MTKRGPTGNEKKIAELEARLAVTEEALAVVRDANSHYHVTNVALEDRIAELTGKDTTLHTVHRVPNSEVPDPDGPSPLEKIIAGLDERDPKRKIADLEALFAVKEAALATVHTQVDLASRTIRTLEKERDAGREEIADLRDKLMTATLQCERMGGYMDALADHEPPPENIPQPTQYQERMLRRDGFGPLHSGVTITKGGYGPSHADTAYSAFTGERAPSWWNRR